MAKWGMVIDISKCNACYCCFTACKDEYWENDYPPYTVAQPRHGQLWMDLHKAERGKHPYIKVAYMPRPCMQCQDAPCLKSAINGAIYRRPDGVVVIDSKKAAGQKQLVQSCPYNAIYWNEEKKLPQKCTFCVHRLEEGQIPRCVQACPNGCLNFGDLENPESSIFRLLKSAQAEVFHAEWKTSPNVYYIDLKKITRSFIAGTVVFGNTDECAEGVISTLEAEGKMVKTRTNNYGDFEFDGLNPGKYTLKLESAGYATQNIPVALKTSTYLGNLFLSLAEKINNPSKNALKKINKVFD
jgi:Fe-S-cluster-containing dehydrogenase component